jgi:hypothetical protein
VKPILSALCVCASVLWTGCAVADRQPADDKTLEGIAPSAVVRPSMTENYCDIAQRVKRDIKIFSSNRSKRFTDRAASEADAVVLEVGRAKLAAPTLEIGQAADSLGRAVQEITALQPAEHTQIDPGKAETTVRTYIEARDTFFSVTAAACK